MASVPLLTEEFGDEFSETSKSPDQLTHPYVTLAHIFFRSSALVVYLLCKWFTDSYITSFVFVVLLLSADFWTVKNITGRILVGLRWWNYIDDTGVSHWVYESRDKALAIKKNAREVRIFWLGLIVVPVIWSLFLIVTVFGLNFKWALLVMIALTLNGANLHGYIKCNFGANKDVKSVGSDFLKAQVFKNAVDMLTKNAQPPLVHKSGNNTGIV